MWSGSSAADELHAFNLGRFWIDAGSKRARQLPVHMLVRDVQRVCRPAITFRCSWWQVSTGLPAKVDRFQRKLAGLVVKVHLFQHESWEAWRLRKGRIVASRILPHGKWSKHVAHRIDTWAAHIVRNHNSGWAGHLYGWMPSEWFQIRRLFFGSKSVNSGRTDTRLKAGSPHVRYHDGVVAARDYLR